MVDTTLKVLGNPNLVRRASSPGVLVNVNSEGYRAFKSAREKSQEISSLREDLEALKAAIQQLTGGSQ